ncbi:FAD:protein FMN transferase [Curtobacterium flaccumfaciens]|uniref:FAD:protein FMN transferase n=1 Tax=Curtobacterium flaccumfaciens TaxID=2035 RepID=UPI003442060F
MTTSRDHVFSFDSIGTQWQIVAEQPLGARLGRRVLDRVEAFDRAWSRFRADSLVARLAHDGGSVTFPDEADVLFGLYDQLHTLTDGGVDPLVGRDLELLGYDPAYTLRPAIAAFDAHQVGGRRRWDDVVTRSGATVTTLGPTLLDVGAAGKGLLVDILGELLDADGVTTSLIDGGGDMRSRGSRTDRIGLEHPLNSGLVVGVVELRGGAALCASSTTRRTWGRGLHHVLDGRTGLPTTSVVATWVVAANAMTADGLATALFTTPAAKLSSHFDFASALMLADGRLEVWGDFPGEVFTTS